MPLDLLPVDFLAAVSEALPSPSVIHWARVSRGQRALYIGDQTSFFPFGGLQFSRLTGKVQRNPTDSAAEEWASCMCPDSLRIIDIDSIGDEPCGESATMLFSKLVERAVSLPRLVEVTFMKNRSGDTRHESTKRLAPPSPSLVLQLLQKAPNLERMQLWDIGRFCHVAGHPGWSDEDTGKFVHALHSLGIRHESLQDAQSAFPHFHSYLNIFADVPEIREELPNRGISELIMWKAQYFISFPRFDHYLNIDSYYWLVALKGHLANQHPLRFGKLRIDIRKGDSLASGKALADILTICSPRELELECSAECEFQSLAAMSKCRRTFDSVEKIDFSNYFIRKDDWSGCALSLASILSRFTHLKDLSICTGGACLCVPTGWKSIDFQTLCDRLPVLAGLENFSLTGEACGSSAHDGAAFAKVLLTKLPNVRRFEVSAMDCAALLGFRLQLENALLRGNTLPSTLKTRWSVRLSRWGSIRCSKYDEEDRLLDQVLTRALRQKRTKTRSANATGSRTLSIKKACQRSTKG